MDTIDKSMELPDPSKWIVNQIHSFKKDSFLVKEFNIYHDDRANTIYEIEDFGIIIKQTSSFFADESPELNVFILKSKDPKIRKLICEVLNEKDFFFIYKTYTEITPEMIKEMLKDYHN